MGETYCGKNCEQCNYKERLECSGCKTGPGRELYGECKIASCCRGRAHQACNTCMESNTCAMLSGRGTVPEFLLKTKDNSEDISGYWAEKAPALGKWMMVLFVLNIVNLLVDVLTIDTIRNVVPGLYIIGSVLGLVIRAGMVWAFFKLQNGSERFRTVGICMIVSIVVGAANGLIPSGYVSLSAISFILTVAMLVLELVMYYQEFKGFEETLEYVYPMLSESWNFLWKLFVGYLIGYMAGIVLLVFVQILGVLVMIISVIIGLVASVLRLVYMYRSATKFKYYSLQNN